MISRQILISQNGLKSVSTEDVFILVNEDL